VKPTIRGVKRLFDAKKDHPRTLKGSPQRTLGRNKANFTLIESPQKVPGLNFSMLNPEMHEAEKSSREITKFDSQIKLAKEALRQNKFFLLSKLRKDKSYARHISRCKQN